MVWEVKKIPFSMENMHEISQFRVLLTLFVLMGYPIHIDAIIME